MINKPLIVKTSEIKMDTIYVSLCKLQSQLTTVEKTRQGFNFKYADLSDIWAMIRKPLAANNFSLVQLVQTIDGRNYIITKLIHVSGEMIESQTLIEFTAKKFQEVGSSHTYYRRYALSAMLGIVSDEDVDDKLEKQDEIYEKAKEAVITPKQLADIEVLINGYDFIRNRMTKHYKGLKNIPLKDYESVVKSVNKLIEDQEKSS